MGTDINKAYYINVVKEFGNDGGMQYIRDSIGGAYNKVKEAVDFLVLSGYVQVTYIVVGQTPRSNEPIKRPRYLVTEAGENYLNGHQDELAAYKKPVPRGRYAGHTSDKPVDKSHPVEAIEHNAPRIPIPDNVKVIAAKPRPARPSGFELRDMTARKAAVKPLSDETAPTVQEAEVDVDHTAQELKRLGYKYPQQVLAQRERRVQERSEQSTTPEAPVEAVNAGEYLQQFDLPDGATEITPVLRAPIITPQTVAAASAQQQSLIETIKAAAAPMLFEHCAKHVSLYEFVEFLSKGSDG